MHAGVLLSQTEAKLTRTVRVFRGAHLEIIVELILQPVSVVDLGGRFGESKERRQFVDGRQFGFVVERCVLQAGR